MVGVEFRTGMLVMTGLLIPLLFQPVLSGPAESPVDSKKALASENYSDRMQEQPAVTRPADSIVGPAGINVTERISEMNRKACIQWCEDEEECDKCRPSGLCGDGYNVLRTWGGAGVAWDACKFVSGMPSLPPNPPDGPPEIPGSRKAPVPPIPR
jgi:hypothetical protein